MLLVENLLSSFLTAIGNLISLTKWFVLPVVIFYFLRRVWMIYTRVKYLKGITWSILEIKIPKEILKTPKAMEQIFAQIYGGIYSYGIKFLEKYWDGKIENWLSFELVGQAGSIHFFVYVPSKFKNLIISSIYSQYPDAEISEIEDYMKDFPKVLPNQTTDLWGTEFKFIKDDSYPIRVYSYFEEIQEEKRIDPLSAVFEAMSQLKSDEIIILQFLICPTGEVTGDNWKKEGEKTIERIASGKKEKKKSNAVTEFVGNLIAAPVQPPVWSGEKKEEAERLRLRPDEQEIIKAIANKISKSAFRTNIRFIYIDSKDSFSPNNVSAVMGVFNQFNTENLNAFKPNNKTIVPKSFLMRIFTRLKEKKILIKKKRIYEACRERRLLLKTKFMFYGIYNFNMKDLPLLNIEELATIYHYPITTTTFEAPSLKRMGAKTGGPPAELPIE